MEKEHFDLVINRIQTLSELKEELSVKLRYLEKTKKSIYLQEKQLEAEIAQLKDNKGLLLVEGFRSDLNAKIYQYWLELPTYQGSPKGITAKVTQLKGAEVELEILGNGVAWSLITSNSELARKFRDAVNARSTSDESITPSVVEDQEKHLKFLKMQVETLNNEVSDIKQKKLETEAKLEKIDLPFSGLINLYMRSYKLGNPFFLIFIVSAVGLFIFGFNNGYDIKIINTAFFLISIQWVILFFMIVVFVTKHSIYVQRVGSTKKVVFNLLTVAFFISSFYFMIQIRDLAISNKQIVEERKKTELLMKEQQIRKEKLEQKANYFRENRNAILNRLHDLQKRERWDEVIALADEYWYVQNAEMINARNDAGRKKELKKKKEEQMICKATISRVMFRDVKIMTASETNIAGVTQVTYLRPDDRTRWTNECKLDGNKVIWRAIHDGTPGRWRVDEEDDWYTYKISDQGITITEYYRDREGDSYFFAFSKF